MAEYKQYITQIQENGNVMISEDVIATIVENALTEVDGVVKGGADVVGKKSWGKGMRIAIAEDNSLTIGCNIIAFLCMNYSISIIGATRRSAFAGLSTVVTLVASAIVLDEKILPLQFLAAALILGGVTGVNVVGILKEKKDAALS